MASTATKLSRTTTRHVLVVPALALLFGLSACSGGTPAGSEPTRSVALADSAESITSPSDSGEFVGDWMIELFERAGQTVTGDAMRQQGGNMTLVVRADGTFTVTGTGPGAPEPAEGTWTSTSGTSAVFTMDGSGVEATLDGDRLTLAGDNHVLVFARY